MQNILNTKYYIPNANPKINFKSYTESESKSNHIIQITIKTRLKEETNNTRQMNNKGARNNGMKM